MPYEPQMLPRIAEIIARHTACDDMAEACKFALEHVFNPPKGWYPESVFPDKPGDVEQQIEDGRDPGAAYVSRAREMLQAALRKAGVSE